VIYYRDSFNVIEHRFQKDDLQKVSFWWQERIAHSVRDLPDDWVDLVFSKLQQQLSENISL
jgi:putative proteasome-type protease